jgi:hypothetical protein
VVVVWLVLLALIGFILLLESTGEPPEKRQSESAGIAMFAFDEPELGSIEIVYQGRSAKLQRDHDGLWLLYDSSHRHGTTNADRLHDDKEAHHHADAEKAQELKQQVAVTARMRANRRIRPERPLEAYGLQKPQIMIAFYGRHDSQGSGSDPLAVLYVGDLLPDKFSYYAKREDGRELSLIPRYHVALILAATFGADQAPTLQPK